MARINAPQFPRGSQEEYLRYLREEEEQKKKDEAFARRFQAQIEAEKRKREKPSLAEKIRERAINEGTFTAKDGPVTKAEAVRALKGGLKSGTSTGSSSFMVPTEFDEQEGTPMKGEGLMKLPPQSSTDPEGVGNKGTLSGRSIPYIGYGKGVPATSKYMLDRARTTGMLLNPDQYSEKISSSSRSGGGRGRGPTDFELAEMRDQVGEKGLSFSRSGGGRGAGPSDFQMAEMTGRSGEKRDTLMGGGRGRAPSETEMAILRGADEGQSITFDEFMYNQEMEGYQDPRSIGGARQTTLKPVQQKAQLEQIEIDANDIEEELVEANIPPGSEVAKDVKMQVGNYVQDTDTGMLINLDRVQARLNTLEKREKVFKTAQLLTGKTRENFLIRNELIDKGDIPVKTAEEKATEALEKKVKFFTQEEKLAKLLVSRSKGYKDDPAEDIKSKDLLSGAMTALKEGNGDLAWTLAKKAKVPGLTRDMFNTNVDGNAAAEYYGEELYGIVGSRKGTDVAKFLNGYRETKQKTVENLAKIVNDDTFSAASDISKGLYRNALGVDFTANPYAQYKKDGFFMIEDPDGGEERVQLELPDRQLNEGQFWQYLTSAATDRIMRDAYPRFHDIHRKSLKSAGQGAVDEREVTTNDGGNQAGKNIDTGGETQETGSVPLEGGDPLLGLSETALKENNPNNIVGFNPADAGELSMDQLEIKRQELLRATEGGAPPQSDELATSTYNSNMDRLKRITAMMTGRAMSGEGQNVDDSFTFMSQAMANQQTQPSDENLNAPNISSVILSDQGDQEFSFNVFANARRGNDNMRAFRRTKRLEGDFTPKVRQEFFEKRKGKKAKPVMSNGKPVYHIGYGIRLPLNQDEVRVLTMNGMSPSKATPFAVKNINNKHIKRLEKIELTEPQALALMQFRYADHVKGVIQATEGQIDFSNLPNNVRAVVFDMAYNIGPNFLTRKVDPFKNLRASLSAYSKDPTEERLKKVSEDIKDSKYYRSQVQNRASKNITKLFNPAAN